MDSKTKKNYENGAQCYACLYYKKLQCEDLKHDHGCCGNSQSPNWYHVILEHCTCPEWEYKNNDVRNSE